VQYQDLVYRIHARQSMFTRSISDECVEQIVQHGEVIEDSVKQLVIVITTYEVCDLPIWRN
jgi:hypothetical protein